MRKHGMSFVVVRITSGATGRSFLMVMSADAYLLSVMRSPDKKECVYGLGEYVNYQKAHAKRRELQAKEKEKSAGHGKVS